MAYSADDVPFLRMLAKSADRALADQASSALAALVLKFDPDELRDDHGRWTLVGEAVHALEHAAENAPHHDSGPVDPKRDKLKLAGKIHLDPGERLAGSGKVSDEYGSVRLAATVDAAGHRSLRIGVGNSAFGTRDGGGQWTGGPDRHTELAAQHADLAGQRDELEDYWHDSTDEADKADLQRQIDAIDETVDQLPGSEPAGHTARLDASAAQKLHDVLADVLTRATAEEARVNELWSDFETADTRLDEMDAWPDGRVWSQAEKDEWQRVLARRRELGAELGADRWPDDPAIGYTTFAEGTIPGDWGTLHYESILDDPTMGTETKLFVVPPGMDPDDVSGNDEHYILDLDQVDALIKQLHALTPGPADKAAAADLLKWTYNPNQSRSGGRFTSGTGANITSGGDVVVSGRQGTSIVPVRPLNAAAARASSGKPANGAAARLTPQVRRPPVPPPKPAGKPKPKPAGKPAKPATAKPAAKPTPGPEAATRSPHTAIGSQDGDRLTVSHRSTTQTRQADARERGRQAATRAKERAELNAVRVSLAAAKAKASASKATTKQRDAAVNAMKSKYGIPKSLRHVSKDRQQAASDMGSATRKMVTDRARITTAQAQVAAVRAQYKKGQSAQTSAYLNSQLAKAQQRLNAANTSLSSAQSQFNAAAKKWRK